MTTWFCRTPHRLYHDLPQNATRTSNLSVKKISLVEAEKPSENRSFLLDRESYSYILGIVAEESL